MSDDKVKTDDAEDAGPVGGERLRQARRENNISVRDVAKELHLDEPKVRALERNEFDVLGAPVFAKGHLRKYAELVGVSIEDVMTDYYQMNRSVGAPPVVGPKRPSPPREINPGPWIVAAIVIVIIAGGLYWWFAIRSTDAPPPAVEPATLAPFNEAPAPEPVAETPEPADEPEAGAAGEPEPEAQASEDEAAEALLADAPAAVDATEASGVDAAYEPTPGVAQVSLDLAFTGECWTEVSDAGGRRLFYDLGTDGRIVTLSGDAPLRVILGDSENVQLFVDGDPWPIPASSRSGRLARLTINPR
jgi:cytoskeleton protein RodZ